jgi:hypothetical protein
MKTKINILVVLAMVLSMVLGAAPAAASDPVPVTVVVTPSQPHGWYFYDDDYPGAVGSYVTGPGTPPAGTGSAQMVLSTGPLSVQRETITTLAYAGTRFDAITKLEYYTFGSVANVQFNMDFDLTDTKTSWMGRLVYQPSGGIEGGGWTKWNPMSGTWYCTAGNPAIPEQVWKAPWVGNGMVANDCSGSHTWTEILAHYPNAGIKVTDGGIHLKANAGVSFNGSVDAFTIKANGIETTYDFDPQGSWAGLNFVPESATVASGSSTIIGVNLNNVSNLYGYQFNVSYNKDLVDAQAWFGDAATNGNAVARPAYLGVQQFFKTASNAFVPWNAVCAAGTCQFSVSKTAGLGVTPISGSGLLAYIVLTGKTPGTFDLTFSDDKLATIDGVVIPTDKTPTPITVIPGTATVNGAVNLQGRATPIDAGTVTLTSGLGTVSVPFSASTGAFSASVLALVGGTSYTVVASHSLYLANQSTVASVTPGGTFSPSPAATTLKGGDANNDGTIDIGDLSCIGGAFGGAPVVCGTTGSSDVNWDGATNIFDLVLAGGNYGSSSPLGW